MSELSVMSERHLAAPIVHQNVTWLNGKFRDFAQNLAAFPFGGGLVLCRPRLVLSHTHMSNLTARKFLYYVM